ncbi:PDDEXK nuclease domain-containing protein [Synergistaceae bacterium OttesenSCG-928-I11]|nr:PDDEXK nuclease domain-containing protein [Synergistaceae bacterium OttesenSCG-928-I11]
MMDNQITSFTLPQLAESINSLHCHLVTEASRAVNMTLTLRNWLIGCYIAEYELNGEDRATYGEAMLENLSEKLTAMQVSACGKRQLYRYILFYKTYPQIVRSVTPQLQKSLPRQISEKMRSLTAFSREANESLYLLQHLSYTHFEQLLSVEEPEKRAFYQAECIRGNWSVRELKRQIGSLYYERTVLSTNKEKLVELTDGHVERNTNRLNIRDPYVFEFLGLKPREVMSESHLENDLIEKLEMFLLELGQGFCFEARQKRILIGGEYFFVDLVFYHRILKCHVLVELKLNAFNHENLGQLNTYVSWYRENMTSEGDNPPIGILLCTDKNHSLVEYALAGMDNKLFVSRYLLELPSREEMLRFVEEQMQ